MIQRRRLSPPLLLAGLLALTAGLSVLSLMAGKTWIPFGAWLAHGADPRWVVIYQLRLPRTLLGLAVGAALGVSGAALQGYTRNPLAEPGVLGVSGMAALGAVLTLYLGLGAGAPYALPLFAMVGAGVGVGLLITLAGTAGGVVTFLLAGVVLSVITEAGIWLALSLSPDPWASSEIMDWLMGSLADRSLGDVQLAAPLIVLGAGLILTTGRALDALTLGETGARSLGVSLWSVQLRLAAGVGLACGAAVAVTGMIGFVGLIVPHLLRRLVGARPSALLLPSAVGGAALVLAADIVVRLTPAGSEVKLGVAMAALGGPFFLVLLLRMRRRVA
jgi:iron complex transport system permease protein